MQIKIDYGRTGLYINVPDNADVFLIRESSPVSDEIAAIRDALNHPIDTPPLGSFVSKGMRVVIVHTDITRATPNQRMLPVILEELEANGVKQEDITLLNALGTHQTQTDEELKHLLGREIVTRYRCLQHDAYDDSQLVSQGESSFGHLIQVNRALLEADLNILTGFIEPHFFAGYSGGPKAILPGVAGKESIFANHSPAMITRPNAAFNITQGNPIWEEVKEAALWVKNTFLVNVTLDRNKRITGVFAGDTIAAHARGCQSVRDSSLFTINEPYDIVITSNSGYPLDQNLYQCVKGMAAAKNGVRQGGAILLIAACEEGLPNHSAYAQLLKESGSLAELLNRITQPDFLCQDSWQVQIQAQVQSHADVYLYSEGLSEPQICECLLQPCKDIPKTLDRLISDYGTRVAVLPQGPLTILQKE